MEWAWMLYILRSINMGWELTNWNIICSIAWIWIHRMNGWESEKKINCIMSVSLHSSFDFSQRLAGDNVTYWTLLVLHRERNSFSLLLCIFCAPSSNRFWSYHLAIAPFDSFSTCILGAIATFFHIWILRRLAFPLQNRKKKNSVLSRNKCKTIPT